MSSQYSSPQITDLGSIHELTLGGKGGKHYTAKRSKHGGGHDARGCAEKTQVVIHDSSGIS